MLAPKAPKAGGGVKAVILIGHGSKARGFASAMRRVAAGLNAGRRHGRVVCAYLDVAKPAIPEAIEACVRRGAREIKLVPYFVLEGLHVKADIPAVVRQEAKKYAGRVKILLAPYLGYDALLVALVKMRIGQA